MLSHELRYDFIKPKHARLDVVVGSKSSSRIVWSGGGKAVAYRRERSFQI